MVFKCSSSFLTTTINQRHHPAVSTTCGGGGGDDDGLVHGGGYAYCHPGRQRCPDRCQWRHLLPLQPLYQVDWRVCDAVHAEMNKRSNYLFRDDDDDDDDDDVSICGGYSGYGSHGFHDE